MKYGNSHFCHSYGEYYFKKSRNEVQTQAEIMLQNIEESEIRIMV